MTRPLDLLADAAAYVLSLIMFVGIIYMICLIGGAEWAERVVDALKEAI